MKKLILLSIAFPILTLGQNTIVQEEIDSANFYMIQAQNQMQQGNLGDAQKGFMKAAELQPDKAEAYIGWFTCCMHSGKVDEGINAIDRWIEHNPEDTTAWLYKGFLEAEIGHPEEALKAFERLIELQPEKKVNYVGKGQMLYALERYEDALKAYEIALNAFPDRTDVWGMKAVTLARLGKYDEAIASVNKGLELTPEDATCFYNRACIFAIKGEKTTALADLKKAIGLDASFKEYARSDADLKTLYDDEDFLNITK